MRYLSVCSGIEAATVAWHPLGWTPVGFSEIEAFPSAVLAHHYPDIPNYGDMTQHEQWPIERGAIDLLVGGTPCQSFSVAGLRKGLKDPRGGLMLTYLEIAQRLRPRWIVWENVPGVLSSNGGRDFGSFLGALGELGYGWAYRVLDAQWCRTHRHPRAVPQRRRRVFVVGCLGDGDAAAAVLLERESVRRDTAPRRASGQGSAADAETGARAGRWWDGSKCAGTLTKHGAGGNQRMPDKDNFGAVLQPVVGALTAKGPDDFGAAQVDANHYIPCAVPFCATSFAKYETGVGTLRREGGDLGGGSETLLCCTAQPVPYDLYQITAPINRQNRQPGDPCHTLARDNAAHAVVAFQQNTRDEVRLMNGDGAIAGALSAEAGMKQQNYVAAIQGNLVGRDTGGPHGVGASEEGAMYTLTKADTHAVAFTAGNLARGAGASPNADVSQTLQSQHGRGSTDQQPCVAHAVAVSDSLVANNNQCTGIPTEVVSHAMTVRRLTPRECERLQGFPNDYTAIPWRGKAETPDGPRYKALGNSMAVNCMEWIGERIAAQEVAQ